MRAFRLAFLFGLIMALGMSAAEAKAEHHEGGPKVMQAFLIDAEAKDVPAVLTRLTKLQELLKAEGQPGFRAWMLTYAGPNTGRIVLTVERGGYADFGTGQGAVMGSAAVQKWATDMNNSGLAKVASQSLLHEITP